MKRLLALLSCMVLTIGLCACSREPAQPTEDQPQIQTARFDCHEYDLNKQTFTDNILLSITLTSDFEETDRSVLLTQDNIQYIGEFRRKDTEGNVNKTVSVFELNDPNFRISSNCSRVSDSWTIANNYIEDDTSYTRVFYTEINNYIVGMSIVNNTKDPLSIDDALQNLAFMTKEECHAPVPLNQQSVVVEGSLESPARTGEWVSTVIYNPEIDSYEPVCICITKVETGQYADKVIKDYNNIISKDFWGSNTYKLNDSKNCCWAVYRYSIFFPSSFTAEGKITDIESPITICNLNDDGRGIGGYTGLQSTLVDISPEMKNVKPGTIWSDGVGFFEIPKNTKNYLIKISVGSNSTNTKYFRP